MKGFLVSALMACLIGVAAAPEAALARPHDHDRRDRGWRGDRNDGWDPARHYHRGNYRARRLGRDDRIYRGGDGRYYCRRNDGTTGLVIGGIAGGLLGNAIGGDTLGTLLGAGGGAVLGRSIDRGNVRCR
ncbi:glycine zipper 2TM domain-containing protein [Flavisphingomonas formosensis]|uniref:glycine zipper 2TM domain-containing protein n=1 Tax=Flavisphingomonas formosensis TaxID=861534 RepID=UPI0012FA0744|nr:glycine zipper 2TM domain-containing protein [Sphingomonas formosensis]